MVLSGRLYIRNVLFVLNSYHSSIEVTTQDIVTPSFVVSSELRTVNQLGSSASSATVGDTLYWTIDIPCKFRCRLPQLHSNYMFIYLHELD